MTAVFIDSDLRRFYEVPDVAHTITYDGGGFRRYTPNGSAPSRTVSALLVDIYSPWVRARADGDADYASLAFQTLSGDTSLYLRNDAGWRLVPANYTHEWRILGNLEPADPLLPEFDFAPLTVLGAYPLVRSAAEYLRVETGVSGLTPTESAKLDQAALALPAGSYVAPPSANTNALAVLAAIVEGTITVQDVLRYQLAVDTGTGQVPIAPGLFAANSPVTPGKVRVAGAISSTGVRTVTTRDPT